MTGRPVETGPATTETSWPARAGREPAAAVERSLAALAPVLGAAGLGLGVASVREPCARPAGPAEAAAAAGMPPGRRLEFLAGRRAARRALRAVGLECGEIPRAGRLPVFPPGRAASISHSAGIAVAVAGAPGRDLPLGCDLELRPLPRAAARLILRADEETLLAGEDVPADDGDAPPLTGESPAEDHSGLLVVQNATADGGSTPSVTEQSPADDRSTLLVAGSATADGGGARPPAGSTRVVARSTHVADRVTADGQGVWARGEEVTCEGGAGWSVTELFSAKEAAWKALAVAGAAGGLRDLLASPCAGGLCVRLRADPGRAVRVRVVRVGAGVFSWVAGRA
ncbi:hypothetical protein SUDANB108_06801 [Streptomyces sp. enrichment culture]|uniref:hypothetical protein n=1 Tax=Streptomyces sp. enrichment culture TaxID=1795815 RepID=UPI003F54B70D